jgi:hypothetical protein
MSPTDDPTPEQLKTRKDVAEVTKVEAEAAKAEAEAAKAKADAAKAEAEVADHDSPLAKQSREAASRKEIAAADKDAADARVSQLKSLIPDFGAVKDSTVEINKDGPPLFGSVLTFGALNRAAKSISDKIQQRSGSTPTAWRIFVTSDPDLASSDSIYQDVTTGFDQLKEAADKLLEQTDPQLETAGYVAPLDIAAALASAVPGVLSLLSAHRSLTTASVTVNDLAATAAVAGALKDDPAASPWVIVHDDFQLVPAGGIYATSAVVSTKRQELIGRKLVIGERKSGFDADLEKALAAKKAKEREIADAGNNPPPNLGVELGEILKAIELLNRRITRDVVRLGYIDSLITSIDAFAAAVRAVPTGARRSSLATAALHELLHKPGLIADRAEQFTHVLLVKGQPGQSQQVVNNLPLWFQDKFSTIVDVNVTYMLIETASSRIVTSGTVTCVAKAWGNIGEEPNIVFGDAT